MAKLLAIWAAFKKGKIIANPEKWKNGQITVAAISGVLFAALEIARAFGVEIPLSEDQINIIATVIISINSVFHPVATIISTEKLGLQTKSKDTGLPVESSKQGMPGH